MEIWDQPIRASGARRRAARTALIAVTLAATAMSACTGQQQPTGRRSAPGSPRIEEVDQTFWFGDGAGSLFRIELHEARSNVRDDGLDVELLGTATNELHVPDRLVLDGMLDAGDRSTAVSGGTSDEVGDGESADVRLVARDLPIDTDLTAATLVLGPAGTNQVLVPLDPAAPVEGGAPRRVSERGVEAALGNGASFHTTELLVYPRFVTGTAGERRVRVTVEISRDDSDPGPLLLHSSITSPGVGYQSAGDVAVANPGVSFNASAVIDGEPERFELFDVQAQRSYGVYLALP